MLQRICELNYQFILKEIKKLSRFKINIYVYYLHYLIQHIQHQQIVDIILYLTSKY